MAFHHSSTATLLATAIFASGIHAQNSTTTSSEGSCRLTDEIRSGPVNSTGTAEMTDFPSGSSQNLYLSLTIGKEYRQPQRADTGDLWIYTYLSAPKNTSSNSCIYMFDAVDTDEGAQNANHSCSGILSQNCIDLLQRQVALGPGLSDNGLVRCPSAGLTTDDELQEACGDAIAGHISTGSTIDPSKVNCTADSPPEVTEIPDGYTSFPLYGSELKDLDGNETASEVYDKAVTRPVPLLIAGSTEDSAESRVVCITPNQFVGNSRVPETLQSAGVRLGSSARQAAIAVVGVVGMMLVFVS